MIKKIIMVFIAYLTLSTVIAEQAIVDVDTQSSKEIYSKTILDGTLTVVLKVGHCKVNSYLEYQEANPNSTKNPFEKSKGYVTVDSHTLCVYWTNNTGIKSQIWTTRFLGQPLPDSPMCKSSFAEVYEIASDSKGNILFLYRMGMVLGLKKLNPNNSKVNESKILILNESSEQRIKYTRFVSGKLIILSARIVKTSKQIYVFVEQNGRDILWDCSSDKPTICWQKETTVLTGTNGTTKPEATEATKI